MLKEDTAVLEVLRKGTLGGHQSIVMSAHQPELVGAIESKMGELGINATQLALKIGFSKSKVSEVLNRKRPLSKKMARSLYEIGLPANVLFKALIDGA
ncbi:MAG: antitoxin component HigA of HigAB toxin-antitoxin module [Phenylobacterium sp.]|jgi:antitoxin component HigA of HigAB toxin-antitoxin module